MYYLFVIISVSVTASRIYIFFRECYSPVSSFPALDDAFGVFPR